MNDNNIPKHEDGSFLKDEDGNDLTQARVLEIICENFQNMIDELSHIQGHIVGWNVEQAREEADTWTQIMRSLPLIRNAVMGTGNFILGWFLDESHRLQLLQESFERSTGIPINMSLITSDDIQKEFDQFNAFRKSNETEQGERGSQEGDEGH